MERAWRRRQVIVVGASVLANALTDDGPVGIRARAELARDEHWAGPEHLIPEVFSAIRGRWLGQQIGGKRAEDALAALRSITIDVVAAAPLLNRMWELRNNVTGYDAAYVAIAEALTCPLVTADARLTRVPDLGCDIRLTLPPS